MSYTVLLPVKNRVTPASREYDFCVQKDRQEFYSRNICSTLNKSGLIALIAEIDALPQWANSNSTMIDIRRSAIGYLSQYN